MIIPDSVSPPHLHIVSGGQTGVDRGALDAAMESGLGVGGWCAAERLAEDGAVPERYPLTPAPRPGYRERTFRNVLDSDATWIIYNGMLSGGTEETLHRCIQLHRPYLLTDAQDVAPVRAGLRAAQFVTAKGISTLNVAGPRTSQWPGAHAYTFNAVQALAARVASSQ